MPDATLEQTEIQREIVEQSNDLRQPLYQDESRPATRALYAPEEEQVKISALCAETAWSPQMYDEDELPIWLALARLMPCLGLVDPAQTDPNTLAYHWSKVRCLFAGAGYRHHDAIAEVLTDLYSACDMVVGQTEVDWVKDLQTARNNCGWPAHIARLPWIPLIRAIAWIQRDEPTATWQRAIAMVHVIKHLRTRFGGLSCCFNAVGAIINQPSTNVIAADRGIFSQVVDVLGCPKPTPKQIHPLTAAVQQVLRAITVDRLLRQQPLAELPGTVIAGPWSKVDPDPQSLRDFIQTGLRLDGVWVAAQGKVSAHRGKPIDVVSWSWNLQNPDEFKELREGMERVMPSTYPTGWPSDILLNDFPNIDISWATDKECAKVLLELPLFASMLRRPGDPLGREYPFVLFLPAVPTIDESTEQGKTALTRSYVRAMSPGAPTIVPPDTSSAPDSRAFVDQLSQFGTVGLDEWTPPQTKAHPLSHQNLQTLCTGGGVTFGRVLENSGMVSLRHSLVAGCKAVEFPPDMVSRTLVWVLRAFTPAERARPDVLARVDSGQLALMMRLAALHQLETHDLRTRLDLAPHAGASAMRFDEHAKLAELLYLRRTGQKCQTLTQTLMEMRARLAQHVQESAASGVLSMQEGKGYLNIRVSDLFAGVSADILGMAMQEGTAQAVVSEKNIGKGWNTVAQVLDAMRKARGFPTLQAMLPAISGHMSKATDRQIILAVSRSIKATIAQQTHYDIPETGFALERGTDMSNTVRIKLTVSTIAKPSGGDSWAL